MPIWRAGITERKDPDAKELFGWDFAPATNGDAASDWLSSGDTVSSAQIIVSPTGGLAVTGSVSVTTSVVSAELAGGTAGTTYTVTCRATTAQGHIVDRSRLIAVKEDYTA